MVAPAAFGGTAAAAPAAPASTGSAGWEPQPATVAATRPATVAATQPDAAPAGPGTTPARPAAASSAVPGWGARSATRPSAPVVGSAGASLSAGPMKVVAIAIIAVVALGALGLALAGGGGPGSLGPDAQIRAGTAAIAAAVSDYAGANGHGPSVDEVTTYGPVAQYLSSWPVNPLTGGPMQPGTGPGDFRSYTATRMPDGSYTGYVYGFLSSGETYAVEFRY